MPDQGASARTDKTGVNLSIFQPGTMPASNGGLLMLGAIVAVSLLAARTPTTDQMIAGSNLDSAAEKYRNAEKRLIEAILTADKNDLGRNEIARRVEGIYSRQTVLTLLGSADLLQRAMKALEGRGLTGADLRVWQGKGRHLLMELVAMDGDNDTRLNAARAALDALAAEGISAQSSGFTSPVKLLAAGKIVELNSRTPQPTHP